MSQEAANDPEPKEPPKTTEVEKDVEGEATQVPGTQKRTTEVEKNVKQKATKVPETQKPMPTKWIILITVITAIGSLQYGYYLWVVKHPAALFKEVSNRTYQQKKKTHSTDNLIALVNSLHVITFSLGGIIGSLLASPLVDKCGRKGTLLLNNYLSMIVSILMGCTTKIHVYEYSFFARLMTGVCAGIFSCVVPLYLGEIAPQNWRGSFIAVSTLSVSMGLALSEILGQPSMLGSEKEWPYLLSFNGFLALFQVVTLPTFPESPRYLLIQRKNEQKAKQALQSLRCQCNVENEIQQIYQEDLSDKLERHMHLFKLISYRGMRWQVISVVVLICGQQLTGLKAVYYYVNILSRELWLGDMATDVFLVLAVISVFLPLIVVIFLVDRVGRKMLLLMGYGISGILCILLITTLEFQVNISRMAYISSALLLIFLAGHMLGPGPVTNVLLIELFLQSSRSIGITIGGILYWLLNVLVGVVFVETEKNLGSFSFLLFLPMCIAAFFYTVKIIPETTDKSFLDIKKCMTLSMIKRIEVQGRSPRQSRRRSTQHSVRSKKRRKSSRTS